MKLRLLTFILDFGILGAGLYNLFWLDTTMGRVTGAVFIALALVAIPQDWRRLREYHKD